MKIRRLASFAALTGFGVLAFTFGSNAQVSAATCTWNGSASGNMGNSQNWTNCSSDTPITGDTVVFPDNATTKEVVNDLSGSRVFADVQLNGSGYDISGSVLSIDGVLTNNDTNGQTSNVISSGIVFGTGNGNFGANYLNVTSGRLIITGDIVNSGSVLEINSENETDLSLGGVISGTSDITFQTDGYASMGGENTYTGVTRVVGKLGIFNLKSLGATSGNTIIQPFGTLDIYLPDADSRTIAEPFIVKATAGGSDSYSIGVSRFEDAAPYLTFSGNITVQDDQVGTPPSTAVIVSDADLTFTGVVSGSGVSFRDRFPFTPPEAPRGSLSFAGSVTFAEPVAISGKYIVNNDQSGVPVVVFEDGVLKGTGKIGTITVVSNGRVAPGNSPGILTAGNTSFVAGSFYDAEIAGNTVGTEYDQLRVVGTVDLGGSTLNTTLLNGFRPAVGATYQIIDNDGTDAVTGTFKDLPEGASVTVDGVVFKISYVGGDGNDVVLTVIGGTNVAGAPKTPNTGVQFMMANPLVTLAGTVISAGSLIVLSRKYSLFTK